jgi:hypothetical protein
MSSGWRIPLILLIACGGAGRRDPSIEEVVSEGIRVQLGVKPTRVRCERTRCDITLPGGIEIDATLAGDQDVVWESDVVVKTGVLAQHVRAELTALGMDAQVDCGPPLVLATAATRVTCTVKPGGTAWVDVMADGGLAMEVALDDETRRERTTDVDLQGLDDLSRALDTDEAEGGSSDESAEADAGVTQDAQ